MKWVSLKDDIPYEGSTVLVCVRYKDVENKFFYRLATYGVFSGWHVVDHNYPDNGREKAQVLYWCELPKFPKPPMSEKGYFISELDYKFLYDSLANLAVYAPVHKPLTDQLIEVLAMVKEKELTWMDEDG